jgi:hypothetical protein
MKTAILILLLLFVTAPSLPQEELEEKYVVWTMSTGRRWLMHHLAPDDVLKLKDRWGRVEESLRSSTNVFAGTYFQPGFSGRFMIWSSDKGFVYVEYFDVEHPCYFSYGSARQAGEEIRFDIEYESRQSICPPETPKTPLSWIPAGDGEFFIPTTDAKRFGEFYAGRGEFNGFFTKWRYEQFPFPRRWGKTPPDKRFVLPDPYGSHIHKSIEARIISLGRKRMVKSERMLFPLGERASLTPVVIDAGIRQGVKVGMQFVLLDDNDADSQTLKVTKVGRKISRGVVLRQITDEGKEGSLGEYSEQRKDWEIKLFTPLKVGLKVTTSPIAKLP